MSSATGEPWPLGHPWWLPYYPTYPVTTGDSSTYTLKGSGWECPRCHQIWANWVMKCDCQPEPEKCILCQKPADIMEHMPYGSVHDSDPVCNICLARLVDTEYKRLHGEP